MPTFTGTASYDYIYYGYTSSGVTISPSGYYYPTNLVDIIYGNGGNDSLGGYGGDDQIFTGAGNDTAQGGDGNDLIDDFTTSSYGGSDLMDGGAGNDSLYGYDGYDSLYGGEGIDLLRGEADDDILDGGLGADSMYGGTGSDTYYVDDSGDYVEDEAETNYSWDGVYASVNFTLGANIEFLTLTGRGNIVGTGNELANTINGNESANALYGLGGSDSLHGDVGADSLYGGEGADYLDGGTGANYLEGGNGSDNYQINSAADVAMEYGGTSGGIDTIELNYSTSWTLNDDFENLHLYYSSSGSGTGNSADNYIEAGYQSNTLSGLAGNDTLYAGGGNDVLDGGAGIDSLVGSYGNDTYYVDSTSDQAIEYETYTEDYGDGYVYTYTYDSGGTDTVISTATYTLDLYVENLTLTGTAKIDGTGNESNNTITGNTANNSLWGLGGVDTLYGGTGNDSLSGGTGADSLVGGTGDDTYYADDSGDIIVEAASAGADRVYANTNYTLAVNVENLYLFGTASISATGNESANIITGTTGANYERGLGGNDNLDAGSGNDTLDGGTGVDTMTGGAGDDTYYVDSVSDVVTEATAGTAGGADSLYSTVTRTLGANFERLYLTGSAAATGTGNTLDNLLQGNAGANTLRGLAGADTFRPGTGNDILIGGTGNDIFRFSVSSESTSTSRDIIRAGDGAVAFEKAGASLGDRIDLSAMDANSSVSGTQHFAFGTAHTAAHIWVTTSGTNTIINGNTDADSTIEFQIAIEDGSVAASAYTAADFILA